jgi:octaprenyl-diphosphate synthase
MKEPSASVGLEDLSERPDLGDVYDGVRRELDRVEERLRVFTTSSNRLVSEINNYLFQKKGKRIRPALLIICAKLAGYQGEEHVESAALVEFVHTASLIHDDIIDKADVRRGTDSVHARWGANVSVLLGDYLYIKSIALALRTSYPQIIRILTETSAEMIEGELEEFRMSGNLALTEKEYLGIIRNKTASLFAAACRIGGVLGQTPPDRLEAMAAYGENLGMAFQIVDDLLDFQGDGPRLGKPILSDIREGRITLPLIYSLNNNGHHNALRLRELLEEKSSADKSRSEILDTVRNNGALDCSFERAREYSLRCREVLEDFPPSPHRDALSTLAEFVLVRDK